MTESRTAHRVDWIAYDPPSGIPAALSGGPRVVRCTCGWESDAASGENVRAAAREHFEGATRRELDAWSARFDIAPTRESLDEVLVAQGFATFTVTIRAADRNQAERIANAAAGLVRAEFQAITSPVETR